MKRASRFAVAPNWQLLLTDMQIDVESVLKHANLPADTFARKGYSLTVEQYFQFWLAIEKVARGRDLPLLLAEYLSVESFDPPVFACICSDNLNIALQRIKSYKPLIGPLVLDITQKAGSTHMAISCYGNSGELPIYLNLSELVFFTQMSRLATRHRIEPLRVGLPELPDNREAYEAYFGCRLEKSEQTFIEFKEEDTNRPFLTGNSLMWEFFETKLNRKLADLNQDASTTDRVRSVLLEQLPSGDSSVESVASKMAMSKRTLQRKLTAEAESFKSVLQGVRSDLADHYLRKSQMSLAEISFLLGFHEVNSFIRAYSGWKGISPGQYREMH